MLMIEGDEWGLDKRIYIQFIMIDDKTIRGIACTIGIESRGGECGLLRWMCACTLR